VLEYQLKIPFVDLNKYDIDQNCPLLINEALARKHSILPVRRENNDLIIAMSDPLNLQAQDDVRYLLE
jgi:type IV pilus assembly protein PilB